jgi:hypothetical protein
MKRGVGVVMAIIIGLSLAVSSGFAEEMKYSGFLGDNYGLLQPGPKDGAKMLYLKPGIDFRKYKSFMIDSVIFFLADDSEYRGIDPTEMKELADDFHSALVDAITNGQYAIVSEPGPDVARIKFAITNVKHSRPGLSAISSIVPVGLAISTVKRGATGGWTGSGATSAELMVLDSTTNDIIALAADDRSAAFGERFSKWGSAKDAFKFWAGRVIQFLDSLNGK